MFQRLPYRVQIPLGLSIAVLVTAVLVTAITAQISVRSARQEILSTLDRSVILLIAQARPMLAADDTWRVFSLLRDTATLIPGTEVGKARVAVLDTDGRVFAASDPVRLEIGKVVLGGNLSDQLLSKATDITSRQRLDQADGGVVLIDPIRSEDGQTLGFVLLEVEASVFAPKWSALAQPALIAVVLSVMFLVPLGWMVGKRMTRPVARLAYVIERIGRNDGANLQADVPRTNDPELSRIGDAVLRLMDELQKREKAELRALSAERLAAVGRMTAAVAHEINNPLAGLLTATQTLRLHGESDFVRRRTIDLLDRGLQQIRTTVAALLPQVRVDDRPLELEDLDDAITLSQPAANLHGVQVSSHNDLESAPRVPSAVMRQVMLNMLLNAVKAAGYQGRVDSLLSVTRERVQFCVTNTGVALSAEAFEHALAAESGRDPKGFGLWVCRELASHFDGGLELDVSHCGGTRLIFWIPNRDKPEVVV